MSLPYGTRDIEYGEDETEFLAAVINCNLKTRLAFVRKVYAILTCQLLVTVAITAVCISVDAVHDYLRQDPGLLWVGFFVTFGCLMVLICVPGARKNYPLNFVWLSFFTLGLAWIVGTVSSFYQTTTVIQAALITLIVFLGLTIYTFQSKRDFTSLGGYLYVGLLVLILGGFMRLFFPYSPIANTVWAAVGALIFSLYIVFDTFMLLHKLAPDEHILAAISLYLDVINLFLMMLSLITGGGRRR